MFWLTLAPLLALVSASPVEKRFMVTGFDRVRINGPFQVEIMPGAPLAVAAGDAKALDHVTIRIEGSTLVVGTGTIGWELRAAEAPGSVKVTIHAASLQSLSINGGAQVKVAEMRGGRVDLGLNGAGAIDVAAIRAEDLNVTLTGTGAITLAGTSARMRVRSYGAGSVLAGDLSAGDATIIAESSGEVRLHARYTAQVRAMGTGGVTITGNPKCRVAGPGPVACGAP